MARSKRTPERSALVRARTPAFSRRQRPGAEDDDRDGKPRAATAEPSEATQTEIKPVVDETTQTEIQPIPETRDSIETQPMAMKPERPDPKELPPVEPPEPGAEPWPDATPQPMKPVAVALEDGVVRPRTETVQGSSPFGRPPEMPATSAPPPLLLGDVENPAHMPSPREIPGGNPDDPAPAPGSVPPGDSRSLRRDGEFALIYRVGTCVISRTGRLGTRGQWRVVDYPTSSAASNSYAKECSRFVSEGFSDYRE